MGRGKRNPDASDNGPERTCIVSGETAAPDALIRFALGPGGVLVADLGAKLPGRGAYVRPREEDVARAITKKLFARAFQTEVKLPEGVDVEGFRHDIQQRLAKRLLDSAGLARRAGDLLIGLDALDDAKPGKVVFILAAKDGGARAKRRAAKIAERHRAAVCRAIDGAAMSTAIGLQGVQYVGARAGRAGERLLRDARRLSGFDPDAFIADSLNCEETDASSDGRSSTSRR
ncbi:MAG: DUF448 domain-containing protein [Pseudomonadota bacterium]